MEEPPSTARLFSFELDDVNTYDPSNIISWTEDPLNLPFNPYQALDAPLNFPVGPDPFTQPEAQHFNEAYVHDFELSGDSLHVPRLTFDYSTGQQQGLDARFIGADHNFLNDAKIQQNGFDMGYMPTDQAFLVNPSSPSTYQPDFGVDNMLAIRTPHYQSSGQQAVYPFTDMSMEESLPTSVVDPSHTSTFAVKPPISATNGPGMIAERATPELSESSTVKRRLGESESPDEQERNKRLKKQVRGFPCDECERQFDRRCDLNKHKKHKHMEKSGRPCACPWCDLRFLWPKDVKRHIKQVHGKSRANKNPD